MIQMHDVYIYNFWENKGNNTDSLSDTITVMYEASVPKSTTCKFFFYSYIRNDNH